MNRISIDSNGLPFSRPSFWLTSSEYAKIVSEINQKYETHYKGKSSAMHASFGTDGIAYIYWFEIHGFNDYNIYMRAIG